MTQQQPVQRYNGWCNIRAGFCSEGYKGETIVSIGRGNMKTFIEFALKAQNEMDHFVLSIETNPSKILLINAIIMFDELLRNGLTRGFGYRKRKLPYKFCVLLATAEVRFGNQFNVEHWQLLKNLSEMRNHVAHRKSSNIPFGAIIPNVLKHRFQEEILQTNFMEMLIPQLYDFWKELIKLVYILIYVDVMARVELSESETFANDAKSILDYFIELINGPEGKDIRKQLDEIMRQPS